MHFSIFHCHHAMLLTTLKFLTSLWLPAPYRSKTPFPTFTLWTTHDFVILPIFGQKVQKVGRLNTVGFLYKNSPQTTKSCSHAQQKAGTPSFWFRLHAHAISAKKTPKIDQNGCSISIKASANALLSTHRLPTIDRFPFSTYPGYLADILLRLTPKIRGPGHVARKTTPKVWCSESDAHRAEVPIRSEFSSRYQSFPTT
jgi:hypothetical protein